MRAIQTTFTNETEGYNFGTTVEPLRETYMGEDATMGDIYRACQQIGLGRCTSRVFVDDENGSPRPVGWFFISQQRYEDTGEPYLRGVWVTVGEYRPAVPESVVYE